MGHRLDTKTSENSRLIEELSIYKSRVAIMEESRDTYEFEMKKKSIMSREAALMHQQPVINQTTVTCFNIGCTSVQANNHELRFSGAHRHNQKQSGSFLTKAAANSSNATPNKIGAAKSKF